MIDRPALPEPNAAIAVVGIDIGKNSFHIVGHDERGAIVCARNGPVDRWKRAFPISIRSIRPSTPNFPFSPRHSGRSLVCYAAALSPSKGLRSSLPMVVASML